MSGSPLRVAVLGAGTVGREVVRGLLEPGERLRSATGRRLELAGVAVRDVGGAVARGIPAELLTDAPAHLVAAPDTDVVVEVIGGDEPAGTLVAAALTAAKAVVTANKHLLAHRGPELEAIARRTRAPLRFEAAVGGGIPVLGPLAADLAANDVSSIRGIVNGTTNYILTAMASGAGTYEAVLRDAQDRGYAEADPSGDVEGRDAVNKLVILYRLAFGAWLDPSAVGDCPVGLRGRGAPGITGVTSDDLAGARALGLTLKLVAAASAGSASVVPTAVRADSPLGSTGGVRNRIEIDGLPVGRVGFDGPGAGGGATSSAVLGDLVAIARGDGSTWAGHPPGERAETGNRSSLEERAAAWFAFLPGVPGTRRPALAELADTMEDIGRGVAIRTRPMLLEALRSRLADATPETLDAQIYPIDD